MHFQNSNLSYVEVYLFFHPIMFDQAFQSHYSQVMYPFSTSFSVLVENQLLYMVAFIPIFFALESF
jgi:hypothetical protein